MIISDDIILINENVLRDEKEDDIEHVRIDIMECCLMFIHA